MRKRIAVSFVAALAAQIAEARVVRFVVESREPFAGGPPRGQTGAYERLTGAAYIEVDPRDPLSALIVDLDKVPKTLAPRSRFLHCRQFGSYFSLAPTFGCARLA